jgi:hypothetical protein
VSFVYYILPIKIFTKINLDFYMVYDYNKNPLETTTQKISVMKNEPFTQLLYVWAEEKCANSEECSNFEDWCRLMGYDLEEQVTEEKFLEYMEEFLGCHDDSEL